MDWKEKVPMFSINPYAASREDVANLASELMEKNRKIKQLGAELEATRNWGLGWQSEYDSVYKEKQSLEKSNALLLANDDKLFKMCLGMKDALTEIVDRYPQGFRVREIAVEALEQFGKDLKREKPKT